MRCSAAGRLRGNDATAGKPRLRSIGKGEVFGAGALRDLREADGALQQHRVGLLLPKTAHGAAGGAVEGQRYLGETVRRNTRGASWDAFVTERW